MARSGKARRTQRRSPIVALETVQPSLNREKRRPNNVIPLPKRRTGRSSTMLYSSLAGLLLGAAMIALSLLSVSAPGPVKVASTSNPTTPFIQATPGDPRSLGDANAPVVITEWVDFQCPACRSYVMTREPELMTRYVQTGKVRLVARDFPFIGPESFLAAEAALAAADQGRFWDYRNLLFQNQRAENSGVFTTEKLKAFATQLGLDRTAFDASLDGHRYRQQLLAEVKQGESMGVNATPTVFINGRKIDGVPTIDRLSQLIDDELAKRS